ncbi:MAG: hypothetical protein ACK559_21810, partial [bacterium]
MARINLDIVGRCRCLLDTGLPRDNPIPLRVDRGRGNACRCLGQLAEGIRHRLWIDLLSGQAFVDAPGVVRPGVP